MQYHATSVAQAHHWTPCHGYDRSFLSPLSPCVANSPRIDYPAYEMADIHLDYIEMVQPLQVEEDTIAFYLRIANVV